MERFLVDEMLLRLGRWLRLLGQDVANPSGQDDMELLKRAMQESRTLITRDRGLAEACSGSGAKCIFIRSSRLKDQLKEMEGLGIALNLNPVVCTICNSPLRRLADDIWVCEGCKKLYWHGSHWRHIEETLKQLRSGEPDEDEE
jgi:uncharacterized protein with PIN domain